MLLNTNKERGNAGLSMAIAYFGTNGYTVSIPLNDTQDYDLIVDNGKKLLKVQVKCTCQHGKEEGFVVSLRSMGGTSGTVYKRVPDTNIDYMFVLCGDMSMYLIPKAEIKATNSIVLRQTPPKTLKKSSNDYSKFLVTFK